MAKKLDGKLLNEKLWANRGKTLAVKNEDTQADCTVREWILMSIDRLPQGKTFTREISKIIDKIYNAVNSQEDPILEDAEYNHTKKHFDELIVVNKQVYDQVTTFIDAAVECKIETVKQVGTSVAPIA